MTTHTIPLTNAAARELATLATARGLLAGKSRQRRLAGQFVRNHILRKGIPEPPAAQSEILPWAEATFATAEGVSELDRDAIKAMVKDADLKGFLDTGLGACDLLFVLGLSEADQA